MPTFWTCPVWWGSHISYGSSSIVSRYTFSFPSPEVPWPSHLLRWLTDHSEGPSYIHEIQAGSLFSPSLHPRYGTSSLLRLLLTSHRSLLLRFTCVTFFTSIPRRWDLPEEGVITFLPCSLRIYCFVMFGNLDFVLSWTLIQTYSLISGSVSVGSGFCPWASFFPTSSFLQIAPHDALLAFG